MTTRLSFPVLLLTGGLLLAQEEKRPFSDEEIKHHLDVFDQSYENKELPEADVVATLENLKVAYLVLKAKGDEATRGDMRFQEEILGRVTKGLAANRRPIVNIECARALGDMGDPKGTAPLVEWLGVQLKEPWPNPQSVEYGFRSIACIGATDKPTLDLVLGYATGKHGDPHVAAAAMQGCYEWRELTGETRKRFFDGICAYLEQLSLGKDDPTVRERYFAVQKDGLQALRELGDGATRFESPSAARAWFAKRTKWEKYVGPRFRR